MSRSLAVKMINVLKRRNEKIRDDDDNFYLGNHFYGEWGEFHKLNEKTDDIPVNMS